MKKRYETFTITINKIARSIRKIKSLEMSEFDLKSPHVSCLYYLFKHSGTLTSKELCDICDEDKASISRSIEFLEKNGYISCISKTEKRYKSPLLLTNKGLEVGRKIVEKIDNILEPASDGLTDEDRIIFYKSLVLISDNLQKICDKYGE